jgi:hypothetical protein
MFVILPYMYFKPQWRICFMLWTNECKQAGGKPLSSQLVLSRSLV